MTQERYTPEEVANAVRRSKGLVSHAARLLGCHMATVEQYAARYPQVRIAIAEARTELVDLAELGMWKAVQGGEPWALALVLKTLGKHRGWVERQEHTGADGGPIQQEVAGAPLVREVVVHVPAELEQEPAPPALPVLEGESVDVPAAAQPVAAAAAGAAGA